MVTNPLTSTGYLVEAYKFYNRRDARSHDCLTTIIEQNDMLAAVKGCLEMAIEEREPARQKLYLQAACFGKKFHPGIAIEEYQSVCRLVRVMNILRERNIEPSSSVEAAVKLLVAKRQFELALWIVQYLRTEGDAMIRSKWSEHLINQHQLSDDEVAQKIQVILGQTPSVSYIDIANKAIERHRVQLAIKLLDKESHSAEQIPLLLSLRQYDRVLAHALSSCNSNLIYMAIFKLRESIPSEIPFLELLKKHRLALRYFCNFLAATDMKTLIMLSHKSSPEDELLWCLLDQRWDSALTVAKRTRRDIMPQQIEVMMKLRKLQQGYGSLAPPPLVKSPAALTAAGSMATSSGASQLGANAWVGLSVSDTIMNLISLGQANKAKDLQKRFDVTEKKYRTLEQLATNTLAKLTIQANPT